MSFPMTVEHKESDRPRDGGAETTRHLLALLSGRQIRRSSALM